MAAACCHPNEGSTPIPWKDSISTGHHNHERASQNVWQAVMAPLRLCGQAVDDFHVLMAMAMEVRPLLNDQPQV